MGVRGYSLTVSDKTERAGSVEKGELNIDVFCVLQKLWQDKEKCCKTIILSR